MSNKPQRGRTLLPDKEERLQQLLDFQQDAHELNKKLPYYHIKYGRDVASAAKEIIELTFAFVAADRAYIKRVGIAEASSHENPETIRGLLADNKKIGAQARLIASRHRAISEKITAINNNLN